MGQETMKVSRKLHGLNRDRLVKELRKDENTKGGIVVLQGGESETLHSSDREVAFRQVILVIYILKNN